jgi:tetratricopeptide (TPR) repeat protein
MNNVAFKYLSMGRYEEARQMDEEMLELDPDFAAAHWNLGVIHLIHQRFEAAIDELTVAVELSGESPPILATLANTYAKSGDTGQALEVLEKLKSLRDSPQRGYSPAFQIAYVYEGLGRTEDALDWLDRAFEERDGWLIYLNVGPWFESLRSEKRFQDLLQRMSLPESRYEVK